MATACLAPLKQAYPQASITWAISDWAQAILQGHPDIDAFLETGSRDLPLKSPGELFNFIRKMRAGHYDLAISLVRSPLMSLALLLAGIPFCVGLDSAGRGFAYHQKLSIDPHLSESETQLYLKTIALLGIPTAGAVPHIPVDAGLLQTWQAQLGQDYIVVNPNGGQNPGMQMDSKRYPLEFLAQVVNQLLDQQGFSIVLVGSKADQERSNYFTSLLHHPVQNLTGALSFADIAAISRNSRYYLGNDTGLTHLAAATGVKTFMIMGPSNPIRYAPINPNASALYQTIYAGEGVSESTLVWDWPTMGIQPDQVFRRILEESQTS
ncbi:glycosyltransferase family 9 protein [Anaerolineales bacterium]